MKKFWSDLPNAHHIDWVLASLKENPWRWRVAWRAAISTVAGDAAWNNARWPAIDVASIAKRQAAWTAAWDEAWDDGVRHTVLALVAYDDCDQYLNMGYVKLRTYATLSERPQALLLLPMVYVKQW
jgi:hypothetical protein